MQLDSEAAERWGIAVGDRVVSEQIVPCWKCRYCLRGQYWMCLPHDIYGFKRRTPGAMGDYMIYSADALVHKVPRDLPPHHAAFAEPLACSLHAVERAGITFDDTVVVAGLRPDRSGHGGRRPGEDAGACDRFGHGSTEAGAGKRVRRRHSDQHRE